MEQHSCTKIISDFTTNCYSYVLLLFSAEKRVNRLYDTPRKLAGLNLTVIYRLRRGTHFFLALPTPNPAHTVRKHEQMATATGRPCEGWSSKAMVILVEVKCCSGKYTGVRWTSCVLVLVVPETRRCRDEQGVAKCSLYTPFAQCKPDIF